MNSHHARKRPSLDASAFVEKPRGILRRLYAWVLAWADTPYGTPALFAISFAESSFFPIPPDVLQIALSVSKPMASFYYAGISAIASVLGGIVGWLIGYVLWSAVGGFFYDCVPGVTAENVNYVGELYRDHAFWSILAAAFTPIPFKVFTLAAGIFHEYVPLQTLILASTVGRSSRFFLVASAVFCFGPEVRKFLDTRLELATVILFILLVLGFVAIKTLMH
ncbi:MAG: DedA family protein [Planctomycetales bacterium]|nr:DedA family protein [Planctomycetales bacterium]